MKNIAKDDNLRSEYIRKIVQENFPVENSSYKTEIPKVIVQFWHNLNDIPEDVQECLNSWEPLTNEGFKRVLYDRAKAREFILIEFDDSYVKAFDRCHHPAMQCDYFRLCYIYLYGGFYLDADEIYQGINYQHYFHDNRLKIQPLCYDKESGTMIKPEVFTKNGKFSENWIFYINNNPIIAPAYHPIIHLALDQSTRILLDSKVEDFEIQSTTGPGNLTASLVRHSIASKARTVQNDFAIISDWETISVSPWPLSYRNDKRNWRLWSPSDKWEDSNV